MKIELSQDEVLSALKHTFGYPSYATLNVSVGRKDVNGNRFIVDIPSVAYTSGSIGQIGEEPSTVKEPSLFDNIEQ